MNFSPITLLFLLRWLRSYFHQEVVPEQSRQHNTTQCVHPCHCICLIVLYVYVSSSHQNLGCWTEIKLFIFTQTLSLISPFLNLPLLQDWSLTLSTAHLLEEMLKFSLQWMTSQRPRWLHLFFCWGLWEAVSLLNAALCSAPETSLLHVQVLLFPGSIVYDLSLFLSYLCSKDAKLSLPGTGH